MKNITDIAIQKVLSLRVPPTAGRSNLGDRRAPLGLAMTCLWVILCISNPMAFAQMPMSVPGMMPAVPPALERVGVVAATQGKVKLSMPGEAGHIAESGESVFISQEVTTDAKGHLQILLLDETVFTIGPNSSITIDKFIYDPKSHAGEIRASITKGIFRYVSGKIAAKKSDSVSVKLPTATIGFRGTIVGGQVNPDGSGLAALLGPGDNNDANAPIGSFTIEGEGGDLQDVNRTGFGVEVGANGGLSGVFQLSDEQVNNLIGGLAPSGNGGQASGGSQGSGTGSPTGGTSDPTGGTGGQGGDTEGQGILGGGDMSNLSGETGALTGETSALTGALTNFTADLDMSSNQAAQDAAAAEPPPASIAHTRTTFTQLDTVEAKAYHYYGTGTFTEQVGGNSNNTNLYALTASWDINFDTGRIENVGVSVNNGGITSFFDYNGFGAFGSGDESAVFDLPKTLNSAIPLTAIVSLWNDSNSKIAGQGDMVVGYSASYTAGHSGDTGTGSFSAAAETIPDGITTAEQLARVATGTCHYDMTGDFMSSGVKVGTLTGFCVIDFGSKTIGGGNSKLTITIPDGPSVWTNGVNDKPMNFSGISNGVFSWTNADGSDGTNIVGAFSTIDVALNNNNGIIAQQGSVSVEYAQDPRYSTSVPSGSGTGTGALDWAP
jgi:hypothetical protein